MAEDNTPGLYARMEQNRETFLRRGRECSRYTIPSVLPEYESTQNHAVALPEPWQSFGARAVNNLVSKLTLAILPLNARFFRLAIDEASLQNLDGLENARVEVEQELAEIEGMVLGKIEGLGLRSKVGEGLRYVEVAGNALLHIPADDRKPRLFRMDTFGVERDPRGNIMDIVVRERIAPIMLDQRVKARVQALGVDTANTQKEVEVFTRIHRTSDGNGQHMFEEYQVVNGRVLGGKIKHKPERLPYMHMRGNVIDGENYGRSHTEEYLGDLRALDGLSKALQQGTAQASKVIWMVRPGAPPGMVRNLAGARNGDFVPGAEGDCYPLQMGNKVTDFAVVRQEIVDLKRDLGMAYLMNSTVPRQAERVTAEEIRLIATELDDTLGGIYERMATDLQLPLVNNIIGNMVDRQEIDPLPEQVRPVIVTGLDAIGRGHDLRRLDEFLAGALQQIGPEVLQYINVGVYLQERATSLGIETEQLIKSQEQLQQEQQAQQMAEMGQQAMPKLLDNLPPEAVAAAAEQIGAQAS